MRAVVAGAYPRRRSFHAQNDPQDLAVVVLDKAVKGITPARLPVESSLGNLPDDQQFSSVGYGAPSVTNGPGGQTFHYADIRYVSTGTLNRRRRAGCGD
jgi:hypothetical protein